MRLTKALFHDLSHELWLKTADGNGPQQYWGRVKASSSKYFKLSEELEREPQRCSLRAMGDDVDQFFVWLRDRYFPWKFGFSEVVLNNNLVHLTQTPIDRTRLVLRSAFQALQACTAARF